MTKLNSAEPWFLAKMSHESAPDERIVGMTGMLCDVRAQTSGCIVDYDYLVKH